MKKEEVWRRGKTRETNDWDEKAMEEKERKEGYKDMKRIKKRKEEFTFPPHL
jgi:hypothetical protein